MKGILFSALKVFFFLYVGLCVLLYFFQEKLIFFPEKLSKDFRFRFPQPFEEISIKTQDNVLLHAVLFKSAQPQGVIFYLHGNAGSLNSWGEVASLYTNLDYDVFMLDYRGYGKSEGNITGQKQFYQDVQAAYDQLKTRYPENQIVVLGYSIGTGPATKLASENQPRLLILQAPYYSLPDLMKRYFPFIPRFLLKYRFETYKFISECAMPVVIFHGDKDEIIDYSSSVRLKSLLKASDEFITLRGQSHNGMSTNLQYLAGLQRVLAR